MDLEGRVVLVTGAARRVGRAIALRFARAGCRIAIHYLNSGEEAERTAAECRALWVAAELLRADLGDPAATAALIPEVLARLGRLDVLVNNASVFKPMSLETFSPVDWEQTLRVNVTAPMVLAHAARGALEQAAGRIINLADAAVVHPRPEYLAYVVSKAALETLTRVLARALAPRVNVVGIAPGVAVFPKHYDAERRARLTSRIPLGRAGTEDDVANLAEFLVRAGDYITGVVIPVDGGRQLV
jgi:NAD(P)-dependent dehydrogenase (short-subunit alcohol dehydrogenase family)